MIDFLNQYAPFIITGLGVIAPILPTMIVKAVNDKKAITTFEGIKEESNAQLTEIKELAETLKKKEQNIEDNVSKMKGMMEGVKGEVQIMKSGIESEMQNVSESVLSFQKDDLYQKMLAGLGQLDDLHKTIESQNNTIQRQAKELKEIHKKLGEMK